MIKYCCYYCAKFRDDTCKNPICYNAFAHTNHNWFCYPYENKTCGETITNDGLMRETHKKCWVDYLIRGI